MGWIHHLWVHGVPLTRSFPLIDAHIHLDHFETGQRKELLEECNRQKISLWCNSMDLESFYFIQEILNTRNNSTTDELSPEKNPQSGFRHLVGLGLHPMQSAQGAKLGPRWIQALESADFIGEAGADFHWVEDRNGDRNQIRVLEELLEIAADRRMITQLHTKGAERLTVDLLEKYLPARPLIHWYSGPEDLLRPLVELGCTFTIGPDLLKGQSLVAQKVPRDRVLLETDGPTGPPWITGQPWEQDTLARMGSALAQSWDLGLADTQNILHTNAQKILK